MKIRFVFSIVSLFCYSATALGAVNPNTVVATINVGVTPGGLAITPDGKYAYVANNNNYGQAGYTAVQQDSVTVIDLANNFPKKTIYDASFSEPYTVTINPAGTKAYVTNSNSTTITIIDIATNTVTGTITGFHGPAGMAINSSGTVGYVNNYNDSATETSGLGDTISVVNLNTNTIGSTITITPEVGITAPAPAAIAITPDDKYVYVVNYNTVVVGPDQFAGQGSISVIRTSDNTIVATITATDLLGLFAIAISPNGKFAYVSNYGSNNFYPHGTTVSVIRLSDNTIVDTVGLGIQPAGIAITSNNRYAYVSNYNTLYSDVTFNSLVPGQGTVNIIDLTTNLLLSQTIAVGQSPNGIAISPNGEFAYVSNYISNTISVIALQSFQIAAQGCKTKNRYLTQIDFINKLTWTVSGSSLPVSYFIFRDVQLTDLVGTVLGSEKFEFLDHNRNPYVDDTYYILGINKAGTLSEPVVITVSKNC